MKYSSPSADLLIPTTVNVTFLLVSFLIVESSLKEYLSIVLAMLKLTLLPTRRLYLCAANAFTTIL